MSFLKNILLNNLRILKIIKFNSKIFKKKKIDKNKILLCEFSNNKITQVAFSYLVNNIMNKENCECLSYINLSNSTIFDYIKILVNKLFNFNLGNYGIYKSFNISNYIFIKNNHELKNKVLDIIEKINFKNKRELLNFKLENILLPKFYQYL